LAREVAVAQDIAQQIRDAFLAGSRDTLVERMGITILEIAFRQPRPITIPPARPRPEEAGPPCSPADPAPTEHAANQR